MAKETTKPSPAKSAAPVSAEVASNATARDMKTGEKLVPAFIGEKQTDTRPVSERFVLKRKLTKSIISMAHRSELVCKILSEPYEAKLALPTRTDKEGLTPVVDVEDLEANDEGMLIVSTLIRSAFDRAGFPITGRYFAMRSGSIRDGKRYRDIEVIELEPTSDTAA